MFRQRILSLTLGSILAPFCRTPYITSNIDHVELLLKDVECQDVS